MRIFHCLLLVTLIACSCQNESIPMPDGMKEGTLSSSVDSFVKNKKGEIPSEILNYPGLLDDERDFFYRSV